MTNTSLKRKGGRSVAAYTHSAAAVVVPVLQQMPRLRINTSFKESVEENRNFNLVKCFLQVIQTHKYTAILLHVPIDHFLCSKYGICT